MVAIACVCPPKADGTPRHVTDTVTLKPKLDFRSALIARNTVAWLKEEDPDAGVPEILAALTEVYLTVGIESWTLVNAQNKPLPLSKAAVRQFIEEHPDLAMVIGDEADGLYTEAVIAPLVARASNSSPPMPIDASTSVTIGSSPAPRKRSRPSSTTTTLTGDTVTMSSSHAGVSN